MEKQTYKYDAFISYRHCDLDKFVAENLHRILESYDLPKNIKEKLNIQGKTFKRVFRDQEELPLSSNLEEPIIDALKASKYLIVICSPRLKDSLWCKKEIETFKKLRGRKNIFCVLIEGEPKDSFPQEVLYDEETVNGKKKKKLVEPLAADVRGQTKKEVLNKIKEEKLRLIAPMYNLDYDDLRQRHKMQRQRKILITSIIIAISCIIFALYTSIMLIKINSQQKILKRHQAISLSQKAEDYLKKDSRYNAIKSSYQALTNFNGVKMPYTPEAEYALSESLGVYDTGASYKAISEIKTKGVAIYLKNNSDNKYFAVYDGSEEINLYNSKTLNKIATYSVNGMAFDEYSFSFIGNKEFSYIDEKGDINIVNIKDGKLINKIKKENDRYISVCGDKTGNYLTYTDQKKLYIYNAVDNKKIGEITSNDDFKREIYYSENSDYIIAETSSDNLDLYKQDSMTIHIIKTKDAKEINNIELDAGYVAGILTKGDNAYLLLNNRLGEKFNMLLVSYNYIDDDINWSKTYDNHWGKFIIKSNPEDTNDIAIVNYDTVSVIDASSGETIESFNTSSEIINIYSYLDNEIYLLFTSDGSVNFINMKYKNNIEIIDKFIFNLNKYTKVVQSENGFLLIPKNENRVILYGEKKNKNIKKLKEKNDEIKDSSVKVSDYDKIIKKYNIKNKDLINSLFYDTDKKLLFVNYKNKDIIIYNTKDKKMLKALRNAGTVKYYFGKDKYNRIYIGDTADSYILDKNYDKVGHISDLFKIKKDKAIIYNEKGNYEIKIYTLDEMLKEAKEYLKQ